MTDNYWNNKNNSSSGGGYKPLHDVEVKQPVKREETLRERYKRQQLQRIEELKFTAEDEARCAVHRERVLKEREIRGESSDFLDAINDIVCAVKDATNDLSQSQKKVEVPKFNIDEVLENPELDGIKSVKIDPISMLADDIESLVKDGKEFINNPTLVGAAAMAVTAIPGKYADKVFEKSNFFKKYEFNSPSGIKQDVYQQKIDWDLDVNTRNGIKSNLELALDGRSPFVIKDGKYSQINLHHSKQNAKGPLFELSAKTHQKYYGANSLHPYLPNKHPTNPVDRDSFDLDREAYWIERAKNEIKKR